MKAPLLVLALALTAAAPASEQRIDVALSNFKFTPSTIALVHGQRYVLHLTSSGGHSFAARDFFAAPALPAADRAKIRGGKEGPDSDPAVDLHFTPPRARPQPIKRTHPPHASFGMTGKFVVN